MQNEIKTVDELISALICQNESYELLEALEREKHHIKDDVVDIDVYTQSQEDGMEEISNFYIFTEDYVYTPVDIGYDVITLVRCPRNPYKNSIIISDDGE